MNNGNMIDKINIKCRGGEGSDRLCQSHVKLLWCDRHNISLVVCQGNFAK
ncbi:hypothetical protein LC608_18475 [Nostoc sp. XA010]|nr:hypothetical protein [Nostoc sp. XA010]MCC5658933.1 hypothetical protein [Nostoc sp. XA010]